MTTDIIKINTPGRVAFPEGWTSFDHEKVKQAILQASREIALADAFADARISGIGSARESLEK